MYTYSSTKNHEGNIKGNIVGLEIYSLNNNIQIPWYYLDTKNILWAKIGCYFNCHKKHTFTHLDTYIFTDNLNIIFLINNHIMHPSALYHHPNKLLIATILHPNHTKHKISIHKVRAHTDIMGKKQNRHPNKWRSTQRPPPPPPPKHTHSPYWPILASNLPDCHMESTHIY